jgi:hypothetical protein
MNSKEKCLTIMLKFQEDRMKNEIMFWDFPFNNIRKKIAKTECKNIRLYNRCCFPASFFSRLSMSLSYRESKWSEALLNTLIVNYTSFIVSNQSLHRIYKFILSLDMALN